MRISWLVTSIGAFALVSGLFVNGPRLLSHSAAAAVVGGDCDTFSNSLCNSAGDCNSWNYPAVEIPHCEEVGAKCHECVNGGSLIFGCEGGHQGFTCGYREMDIVCGDLEEGECDANLNCAELGPDPEQEVCEDGPDCCTL